MKAADFSAWGGAVATGPLRLPRHAPAIKCGQRSVMPKHVVATVSEIAPGGRKRVEVKGRAIVLFNLGGEFFALSTRCPHQGGDLSQGWLTCLLESSEPGEYKTSRHGEILRC